GLVGDLQLLVVRHRVDDGESRVARVALFTVLEDVGEADAPIVDLLRVPDAEVAAPAAVQVIRAVVDGELVFLPVQREAALGDAVGVAADDGAVRGPPGHVLIHALVAEHHVAELPALVRHQDLDDLGALVGNLHDHARTVLQHVEIGGPGIDLLLKRLSLDFDVRLRLGLRHERRGLQRDGDDHETRDRDCDPAVHLCDLLEQVRDRTSTAHSGADSTTRRGADRSGRAAALLLGTAARRMDNARRTCTPHRERRGPQPTPPRSPSSRCARRWPAGWRTAAAGYTDVAAA